MKSVLFLPLTLLLSMLLSLPLWAATANDSLQPITLQLRWLHQFQFAGYYAAKQQGYYRDAGLDVEIRPGAPGREPVKEVVEERAHYGVGNSELLHQRLNGEPLVALAAIFQHSASVFLVRQDSGIRTPQDLIGRKVMLISKSADVGLVAMLHNEGVDISRVQLIKSSYDINDLATGKVDAFNSYLTNEPYFMAERHIPVSVIHPSTYGVDFYSDILFTSEQELKKHPQRVKLFREASLRGWQYAMDHPEKIINLIISEYADTKSRDHLRFEAATMRKLIMPNLIQYGHMNPGRWQHMADTLVQQGMTESGYDLEGFIYNPNPLPDLSRWYTAVLSLLAGVLLLSIVAMGLYYYNRRLKGAIDYGRQTQHKLQQQTALFEAIFQSTPDATVISNNQREIILCNPAFSQTFGYQPDEVIGKSAAILYEDDKTFKEQGHVHFNMVTQPHIDPYEINYCRKTGELFPSLSQGGPIVDVNGHALGFIAVIQDITEQKRSQQEIIRMALADPLTGLANRHQFNRKIEECIKLAKRQRQLLSLAIMDLDFFKQVNDQHGHPIGDKLLIQVAKIIKDSFRETDLVARIGGDEFAIIMTNPDSPNAIRQPAERIIEALRQLSDIDGNKINIGASFGVASYPLDTEDLSELYRLADRALYSSKQMGRNCCSLANENRARV
ncbi:MAG: ABC transporter substrate-binding protein [Motiliproteus sp.]